MKYANEDYEYHVNLKKGEVGKYILLPGDPKRCKKIASYFQHPQLMADSREYVTYTGYLLGEKVSVTSTGIGGPSAAIAMEELANLGADTFIRLGTCGGMQKDILGGDMVIATAAVRNEGTSKEYAPIEYPAVANFDIVQSLRDSAKALRQPFHLGVVQCKDSFYGQHDPESKPVGPELLYKWNAFIKMGCLASEMESAALFTVASYRKLRCGALFLCIANQEREKSGLENSVVHNLDEVIQTAIKALETLIERDRKEKV